MLYFFTLTLKSACGFDNALFVFTNATVWMSQFGDVTAICEFHKSLILHSHGIMDINFNSHSELKIFLKNLKKYNPLIGKIDFQQVEDYHKCVSYIFKDMTDRNSVMYHMMKYGDADPILIDELKLTPLEVEDFMRSRQDMLGEK